jgi:hypothetical protein
MSISLHRGPDGEPGGGALSLGTSIGRGRFWEQSVCFCGALRGEPGGGSFSRNFGRYVKTVLVMGASFSM